MFSFFFNEAKTNYQELYTLNTHIHCDPYSLHSTYYIHNIPVGDLPIYVKCNIGINIFFTNPLDFHYKNKKKNH